MDAFVREDLIGVMQRVWLLVVHWLGLVLVLLADEHKPDGSAYKLNYTMPDNLVPDSNSYLNFDFNAFWSHNESYYLSKLDDFDITNFQDVHDNDFDATTERPPWANPQHPDYKTAGKNPNDPIFDNNLVTNVTVQLGGTAFLHCRVRNLGERPVSWVRRRDWHILTSGMFTYTNDERFQVSHTEGGDNWDLQIKYVQKRDNGTYECQVATGRGTISHYYNLHVVVPSAFILGSGEYHIGEGSTISLVCIIENSPSPPQYVFWYHNERMINYDTTRGGVTVSTEPGPKTHSRLIINSATTNDSGNYTCRASNTEADTIYVFVSKGDNTAAIQRQESSTTRCGWFPLHFIIISTIFCAVR